MASDFSNSKITDHLKVSKDILRNILITNFAFSIVTKTTFLKCKQSSEALANPIQTTLVKTNKKSRKIETKEMVLLLKKKRLRKNVVLVYANAYYRHLLSYLGWNHL